MPLTQLIESRSFKIGKVTGTKLLWEKLEPGEQETNIFHTLVNTDNDFILTVLRLVLGIVMFAHGAHWFGGYGFRGTMNFFTQQMGVPAPLTFLAIAAEFFGGLGLIVGLLGRIAAFGILCNMVVAILAVHGCFGLFMNWFGSQKGEGYEYHLLAIALALAILVNGSGAFSIDSLLTVAL